MIADTVAHAPDPDEEARAEEVRAALVALRGGAPFLSSADGQLLASWLEAGVQVSAILRGLDATAARRSARRTRSPFTLRSARSAVEAARRGGRGERSHPASGGEDADATAARLALTALAEADPERRARAACTIVREFHERAWAGADRGALLAEAAEELAELRDVVGEGDFSRLCEEWARDRVRRRYPSLSITRVLEELGIGVG